ncbi:hypothetical protein V5F01_00750 [Streptomyces sp. NRRL B-2790]|uniref:MmyB family transcriptional regulator n=1 Tax=Streptomyces sp. NRRL B-2790 TaxID=1463835 RepID=UPI0035635DD2
MQPQLQRLLDDLTSTPAIVLGRRMNILAWNSPGAARVTDFSRIPEKRRTYVRLLFTGPALRRLRSEWDTVARTCVARVAHGGRRVPPGRAAGRAGR